MHRGSVIDDVDGGVVAVRTLDPCTQHKCGDPVHNSSGGSMQAVLGLLLSSSSGMMYSLVL